MENTNLTKQKLITAFTKLGEALNDFDIQAKICIYGGSALIFIEDLRDMTHDVDYNIVSFYMNDLNVTNDNIIKNKFRLIIYEIADTLNLSIEWMNDAVKIFLAKDEKYGNEMSFANGSLTVLTPTLEYILSMKIVSLRFRETERDLKDIKNIIKKLNIKTFKQTLDIFSKFYPDRDLNLKQIQTLKKLFTSYHVNTSSPK